MTSSLPNTMRAAQFSSTKGGIERNIKVDANAPLPSKAASLPKDHTLVRVAYSALNPIDYKLFELIGFVLPGPHTTCMDYSGTVVKTTRGDLTEGQRVFGKTEMPGFGTLGEYVVVGREGCAPLRDGVSLEQAAAVGVAGLIAYQSIAPHVQHGSRVLIVGGSGGTGTFGVQIAKALGCRVTAICSGANAGLCTSLGADEVIDYRTQDVVKVLKQHAAQGDLYDVIFDTAAANLSIYYEAAAYLEPTGQYNIIAGNPTLKDALQMATMFLLPACLGGGKRRVRFINCATNAEQLGKISKWMAEGKVKAVVDETIELDQVARGFEKLKTKRTRGKIVVHVSDGQ